MPKGCWETWRDYPRPRPIFPIPIGGLKKVIRRPKRLFNPPRYTPRRSVVLRNRAYHVGIKHIGKRMPTKDALYKVLKDRGMPKDLNKIVMSFL